MDDIKQQQELGKLDAQRYADKPQAQPEDKNQATAENPEELGKTDAQRYSGGNQ